MKARHLFDAIGVIAAAAVVAEQATELLGPFFKNASVPSFVPDIVRDIPGRTANAFNAFATRPADYAAARSPRMARSAPLQPGQRPVHARPRPAPAGQRLAQSA